MAAKSEKLRYLLLIVISLNLPALALGQQRMISSQANIQHIPSDFAIADLDNSAWRHAREFVIEKYWSGASAPKARNVEVRLLWSASALYVRFEANQSEPIVVSDNPDISKKTMQLWDRDVCEIFLAPDAKQPRKYLEFEVAPTGEWIDLAIHYTGAERITDWHFNSGMESAAKIEKAKVVMAMKIPWKAFSATPKPGDVWKGNVFRCVGRDPDRGYLAWRPTMTEKPNFHVPEKFGEFVFEK